MKYAIDNTKSLIREYESEDLEKVDVSKQSPVGIQYDGGVFEIMDFL